MSSEPITPDALRKLTQWLDVPLTPGKEKELTSWLASDPENQTKWDRWAHFNTSAKRLQIIPSEVVPEWEILRDEIGFTHTAKRRSKRRSTFRKKSVMRMPLVVAFLSTVVFASFLLILYLIKSSSKF